MRIFSILLILIGLQNAQAESPTANTESLHAILANFGYTQGGMSLGVDYEYAYHRTFGIGGFVRLYPEEDTNGQGSITAFGAFIRPHFTRQSWDLYVSPGFGFVQEEISGEDESYIGPSLMLGLLYQISESAAVGVENMQIYGWFGDESTWGQRSSELLAKFRFSFN